MNERKTEKEPVSEKIICFHCGDECVDDSIAVGDKYFCCNGCKTVYEILNSANLCDYYNIEPGAGIKKKTNSYRNYEFLDDPELKEKLIDFSDGKITTVSFHIPQIHCSSCIWALENLNKLDPGVLASRVNFPKKKLFVKYSEEKTSLRKIVELLDAINYEPLLTFEGKEEDKLKEINRKLYFKIGIAGFCFGNIMMLSFPEYLSLGVNSDPEIKTVFSYLNLLLALPVLFYSASDYFKSAFKGLKNKIVNIDVPIALGIIVLFLRSLYEITTSTGAGYLDSLAGLVFFLLIGKVFQNKIYHSLSFERNYKSYFPISVTIRKDSGETAIPLEKLKVGDRMIIRNGEIAPADSILIKGEAFIDYSFVTGESDPVKLKNGDVIYAGGRQQGGTIEAESIKEVSQSYLTRLWNDASFRKEEESLTESLVDFVSKYFTAIVISIAVATFFYWSPESYLIAFNAFTAVLIVACPCALALSIPFTFGNTLRIFGRNKFYLKSVSVVETLSKITAVVFDKTGTITDNKYPEVKFIPSGQIDRTELMPAIKSLVINSSHPLSRTIAGYLSEFKAQNISDFREYPGKGLQARFNGKLFKIGSPEFTGYDAFLTSDSSSNVTVTSDGKALGYFRIKTKYRNKLDEVISRLKSKYKLYLLTGDTEKEKANLEKYFGSGKVLFRQSPFDKLEFIKKLKERGEVVMMIGDGLNDAGALQKSDAGVSISDNINNFTPACDAILDADSFGSLHKFLEYSVVSRYIVYASFAISFVYNVVGLYFATSGKLEPVIAAILMPLSSITIVLFTTVATTIFAKIKGLL
ncbi:Cation transport ATPase [Melioribacter roseus P3M-2]|uniref:Cation transport ATPase n=1 Tax=Melioribacter roseus (strain DSM 23840 / JCM 17771 / VKM B-2668 / P3M-2) TaxID=1191523 RepID=I7A0G1_MELRP|nr:heavy metal translocating P-type ATPase metal-binding domain-containing protein [Melioribacter roseus]AFN74748.1 Cation transport ATPase [Melioribacter roseus P3M-2]